MRRLLALLVLCAFASPAAAEFPDRPIHLIVPQAAGSATDTLARIFGASFGDALGQTVIIDDRPGGALTVGMDVVAKAPPDGYTLGMAPIGALALTSHLVEPLPYNVERDFAPIVIVTRGQMLLAVSPTTPIHSVKELIDYAKANPGKLLNASSSNGSPGPCRRRIVQIHDRHRHRSRALQRRRRGDQRSDGRTRAGDVREPELDRAVRAMPARCGRWR